MDDYDDVEAFDEEAEYEEEAEELEEDEEAGDQQQEDEFDETYDEETKAYQIEPEKRITTKYLTKFERIRIIEERAKQIADNSPVLVDMNEIPEQHRGDPVKIAEHELYSGAMARNRLFSVRRTFGKMYEEWSLSELIIDPNV